MANSGFNPASFTLAGQGNNILQGVSQGLGAIAQGQRTGMVNQARQEDQKSKELANAAVEAWKRGDRQGYDLILRDLTGINPTMASEVKNTFNSINWDNLVEAGLNIYGAAAVDDINAQNKMLGQAAQVLGTGPDHWMTQGIGQMMGMPQGAERDAEIMGSVEMLKELGVFPSQGFGGKGRAKAQKTGSWIIRTPDKKGGYKYGIATGAFKPDSAGLDIVSADLPEGAELVSPLGETAGEQTGRRLEEKGEKERITKAVAAQKEFFDQLQPVQQSLSTIDEAIDIVEKSIADGSFIGTGIISKYLPKWNDASSRLAIAANKMGLDVISSVTFGALSKAEMDKAMQTAFPENLKGPELLQWLKDKKVAQQKLEAWLTEAALFLGSKKPDGQTNTIADWLAVGRKRNTAQQFNRPGETGLNQSEPAQTSPNQQQTNYTKDNPARITTDEEYNQLKAGDYFIDPDDGKIYVK